MNNLNGLRFIPTDGADPKALKIGFRFGNKGTQTSRTMMLAELTTILSTVPPNATRTDYATAIIENNFLAKPTTSTRRLTNQRLGELYALDAEVPIFRVLRRLWTIDHPGRPLMALLTALARDPLLMATAPVILRLPEGSEFQRSKMKEALQAATENRFNESILDKVVRNAASSWTQSGHLQGRTFKRRRIVQATAVSAAFALYLGHAVGFRGEELLTSGWISALDCTAVNAKGLALEAKRLGLIDLRIADNVFELNLDRLDPNTQGA